MGVIESVVDFRSLSIRDLLDARDQYHWHLTNRPNVVGTAVGLYLIRHDDPWPGRENPTIVRGRPHKQPRTLANSEVRPYSWPCVLVFVSEWVDEGDFGQTVSPQVILPKTLYLPDGRTVPVCVVLVEPAEPATDRTQSTAWPESLLGGGFGLVVRSQATEHRASVGCLVSDGHSIFALTNRHVCGASGQRIAVEGRSGAVDIGSASALQLSRMAFTDVYPSFAGAHTYLNLDVGLVDVDDANQWTASVYGLGEVSEVADLNEANIGLALIDKPVVAYGAASGHLDGTLKALFYRYKSVGGYDYVADFLVAPTPPTCTQPGDSGTVWHVQLTDAQGRNTLHPLAVEWGAQSLAGDGRTLNYALATNLSNVCKLLDVEVVLNHNTSARPYWGATGHYSIAGTAVAKLTEPKLGPYMRANAGAIAFDRTTLAPGNINVVLKGVNLVPLADVPDVVWKKTKLAAVGGRDTRANVGPEHPTHFCDIDEPGPDGMTLRARCMKDPANVAVDVWKGFYDGNGHTESASRGCLPFRVWQFYDAMVDFVSRSDFVGYLCAAGLLAHYVGDASQPLHGSFLADGFKDQAVSHTTSTGHTVSSWPGKGVHSAFESTMIDAHAGEMLSAIDKALRSSGPALAKISKGQDAAVAIVALMDRSARTLPPTTLINTYIALGQGTSKAVIDGLWTAFGPKVAKIMADSVRVLNHIWTAAWRQGGGQNAEVGQLSAVAPAEIIARYTNTAFVPSLDLNAIAAVLR